MSTSNLSIFGFSIRRSARGRGVWLQAAASLALLLGVNGCQEELGRGRADGGSNGTGKGDDANGGAGQMSTHRQAVEACRAPYDRGWAYRNPARRSAVALELERTFAGCLARANDEAITVMDNALAAKDSTLRGKMNPAIAELRRATVGPAGSDTLSGVCASLVDASPAALTSEAGRTEKEQNFAAQYRCRARLELHLADLVDAYANGSFGVQPWSVAVSPTGYVQRCQIAGGDAKALLGCVGIELGKALPEVVSKIQTAFPGREATSVSSELQAAVEDYSGAALAVCELLARQGGGTSDSPADGLGDSGWADSGEWGTDSGYWGSDSGWLDTGSISASGTGSASFGTDGGSDPETTSVGTETGFDPDTDSAGTDTESGDTESGAIGDSAGPSEPSPKSTNPDALRCQVDAAVQLGDLIKLNVPGVSLP